MINYLNIFSEPLFNTGFMASAVSCSILGVRSINLGAISRNFTNYELEAGQTFKKFQKIEKILKFFKEGFQEFLYYVWTSFIKIIFRIP